MHEISSEKQDVPTSQATRLGSKNSLCSNHWEGTNNLTFCTTVGEIERNHFPFQHQVVVDQYPRQLFIDIAE